MTDQPPIIYVDKNQNAKHRSCLSWAAKNGHLDIVKELISRPETTINGTDEQGYSALMWAALNGHFEVVKCLAAQPGILIKMQAKVWLQCANVSGS